MSTRGGSSGSSEGRSVLVEIERLLGTKFRVRLKDVAAGSSTTGDVELGEVDLPIRDLGRYQLVGEIAVGGVGQVLRCRDMDLGRDVAMKVLRERHANAAGTIQRFVEEAQVGGQLQHPGVVPVYELGLRDDRRPYFTMKYVKGKTLAAYMSERPSPDKYLRRYLVTFEQICNTIAFAHARSVIHRDLKPSNILVGAFGEVQVTDWGFAKILRRGGVHDERRASRTHTDVSIIETIRTKGEGSHSIAGSVMGTPAYMPPEQASGDVERLDERADVFALGAVLCEILTGAPPYLGETTDEVLLKAARAQLDEAYARIDACEADERLKKLLRLCLSPNPKDRPRNAKILGRAVSTYLESSERRRRAALVQAAKAKVQAQGDRRVRRLTVALAVTVLIVVLGGGGVFLSSASKKARRAAEIRSGITDAIARATGLAAEAREETPPDLEKLAAAVAAARAGHALAVEREDTREESKRLETLAEELTREQSEAKDRAARRQKDESMLDRLGKLRVGAGTEIPWDQADREYAQLFEWYGVNVDETSPLATAAVLSESHIARELASALDSWTVARQQVEKETGNRSWLSIGQAARDTDKDPWRRELRDAWLHGDLAKLRRLATEVGSRDLDPPSLTLLANALGYAGHAGEAAGILTQGRARHAGDFWLNYHLAYWLAHDRNWHEAVRYYVAALTLRPDFPGVWNNLALARGELGDREGEKSALLKAIDLDAGFARAWYNLALAYRKDGDLRMAEPALVRAVGANQHYGLAHFMLGVTLRDLGREEEGRRELVRAAGLNRPEAYRALAKIHRDLGDYERALEYLFDVKDYLSNYQSALLLEAVEKPEQAVATYEGVLRDAPEFSLGYQTYVGCLDRLGWLDEKLDEWQQKVERDPKDWRSRYLIAITWQVRENWREAIQAYRTLVEDYRPDASWAWVGLGYVYGRSNNYVLSEQCLRTAIEKDPENALAHHDLGAALHRKGEWLAAIEEYRKSLEIEPRYAMAHYNLGFLSCEKGDRNEGIDHLEKALRLDPKNEDALLNFVLHSCQRDGPGDVSKAVEFAMDSLPRLKRSMKAHRAAGFALGHRGGIKGALAAYRKVVPEPDKERDTDFLLTFASARWQLLDPEGAEEAYLAGLEAHPEHEYLLANYCVFLLSRNRTAEGVNLCLEAIERNPNFAVAHRMLGAFLNLENDVDRAVEAWKKAVAAAPEDRNSRVAVMTSLNTRDRPGDREEANRIAREAAAAQPLEIWVQSDLGQTFGWLGEVEAARAYHAEHFPDALPAQRAQFLHGLGLGLAQKDRCLDAARIWAECANLGESNTTADLQIGFLLCRTVSLEEAERLYAKWIEDTTPERRAEFYRGAGNLLVKATIAEFEQAAHAYREALDLLPRGHQTRPTLTSNLAWSFLYAGDFDAAEAVAVGARREWPELPFPWLLTGNIRMCQGEYGAADHEFRAALMKRRDLPGAKMNLGLAGLYRGRFSEAEHHLREAASQGYGSTKQVLQQLRRAERLSELEKDALAILGGRREPEDAADAADLALFCLHRGSPVVALTYFDEAFRRNRDLDADREQGLHHLRIQAVLQAAEQAETGLSGATTEDAAKLRTQAYRLLGKEKRFWLGIAEDIPKFHGRSQFWWSYEHPAWWTLDPHLASVRPGAGMEKLPEGERASWKKFWSETGMWLREVGRKLYNPRNERPR